MSGKDKQNAQGASNKLQDSDTFSEFRKYTEKHRLHEQLTSLVQKCFDMKSQDPHDVIYESIRDSSAKCKQLEQEAEDKKTHLEEQVEELSGEIESVRKKCEEIKKSNKLLEERNSKLTLKNKEILATIALIKEELKTPKEEKLESKPKKRRYVDQDYSDVDYIDDSDSDDPIFIPN